MKNNKIKLITLLMACLICFCIAFVACTNSGDNVDGETDSKTSANVNDADTGTDSDTGSADADTNNDDTGSADADTNNDDTGSADTNTGDVGYVDTGTVDTSKLTVEDHNGGEYNKPTPIF